VSNRAMLKIRFDVKFDKDGNIVGLQRYCDIPRPVCEGCRFKEWCDKVEVKILEAKNEKD